MNKRTSLGLLATLSAALVGVTIASAVNAAPGLRLSASVATQTKRRVFVKDAGTGWTKMAVFYWNDSGSSYKQATKFASDTGNSYYFVDVALADVTGGMLFFDGNCVTSSAVDWDAIAASGYTKQTVNAPALPEWGNADIYTVDKNGTEKASCELAGGIKLGANAAASLLSRYTSCASDLSQTSPNSYLTDILAYPQLQANFHIEEHMSSTVSVPKTSGGEKSSGTLLGTKVSTMREEFASLNLGADVYNGIKVYALAASYDKVFAWGGASTAAWPGDSMTKSGTWNSYDFAGKSMINLIFNKAGKDQTSDLYLAIKGVYYFYDGLFYTSDPTTPSSSSEASSSAASSSASSSSSKTSSTTTSSSQSGGVIPYGPSGSTKVSWYLVGSGSHLSNWSLTGGIQLWSNPGSSTDKGCALNVPFEVGDLFKVTDGTTWYGYEKVDQWEDPSNAGLYCFEGKDDGNGGQNFRCTVAGVYDMYVNKDGNFWIQVHAGSSSSSSSASSSASSSSSSSTQSQSVTVYCPTYYTKAFAWIDDTHRISAQFPGDTLSTYNSKWKYYAVQGYTSFNILFDCGDNSSQSRDIAITHAGTYYYFNGILYTSEPDTGASEQETYNGIKVYCDSWWTHVWAWDSTGNLFDNWPGASLKTAASGWKYYEFPNYSSINLIFSDANGQTGNLSRNAKGVYYYTNDTWYTERPTNTGGLNILHCFDWPLSSITANLSAIKAAGFDAVQTSPVQDPVGYKSDWTDEYNQWWKLYQPLSFKIGDTDWIGNASSLKSLTTAADNLGMKVIVDVVANHMAGKGSDLDSGVSYYESKIAGNFSTYFHSEAWDSDDASIQSVVCARVGGLPDLYTANSYVQERVLDLLKKLIDNGVDGFRFDAAKHIETPKDGKWASNFWPSTLGAARSYAASKGQGDLFAYGEVIGGPGGGRNLYDYIASDGAGLNAVTDTWPGDEVRGAIAGKYGTSHSAYGYDFNGKNTVIYSESHDTYRCGKGTTSGNSQGEIDAAYALLNARGAANTLYFCRPSGTMKTINPYKPWKDRLVIASNNYHHLFGGLSSYNSNTDHVSIVENWGSNRYGATIANPSGYAESVSLPHIGNGTYVDLVTGKSYTVSGNSLKAPANTTLVLAKI